MTQPLSRARTPAITPKLWLLTSAALLSAAMTQSAQAQTAPPGETAAAPGSSVEEIVVTARRREEHLKDVPAAITAFSAGQLQALNITGTKQLTQITPGLNFTQSVYSPQPTIRGVGSRGVNAGEESEVPVYIDGVYQSFLPAADLQFNDVQRIEVLKGPQGALLGRNAMGGAINIITKDPTATPHADLSVSYGSYNQVIAKGYVSGGTDKVAADLAVVENRDDGYIRDIVNGKEYGQTDDVSVRGKLVFHPNEKFDLKVAVSHSSDADGTGESFRNLDGNTLAAGFGTVVATAPYTAALSFSPYNKVFQTDVSGTAVYHGQGFSVTGISAYEDADLKISADADGTPLPLVSYFYKQFSRNEYNEVYIQSDTDKRYNWLAGFVYYHDHSGNPPNIQINVFDLQLLTVDDVYTDSYAGYGQFGYKFNDQWSLTVGGRYTSETKSFNDVNSILTLGAVTTAPYTLGNRATFSKFTPTGTLQYEPNSQLNFYVKAGQAFKSGVFNPSASTPAATAAVRPETLTQYEVGMKAALSSKVQFNLAAYYTDYQNLQSATRTPQGQSLLQNAGKATIYGIEAEAFLQPIDRLNIRLGLSALHGTYGDYADADVYYPTTTGTAHSDRPLPDRARRAPGRQYRSHLQRQRQDHHAHAHTDRRRQRRLHHPHSGWLGHAQRQPLLPGQVLLGCGQCVRGEALHHRQRPGRLALARQTLWRFRLG